VTARRRKASADRDGTAFVALPWLVIDSQGYRACSSTARALLVDIVRQYNRSNNGKLVVTPKWYRPLGWKSVDVVSRAKGELILAGLLFETRRGARPNRASWYALTFFGLDVTAGLDVSPASFPRGGYMRPNQILIEKRAAAGRARRQPIKALIPSDGTRGKPIAPSHGKDAGPSVPSHGAMRPH
jgi:hypothetical protein